MALKIKSTTPNSPPYSGIFTHPFDSPPSDPGTQLPLGWNLVSGSLDYEVKTGNQALIAGNDYPSPNIATVYGPTAAQAASTAKAIEGGATANQLTGYSTVSLYSTPNNPVTLNPSSSYRRRITSNSGNVGIRG